MRDNVNRLMDRGGRLDDLQMRSEALDATATDFRAASERIRRKTWWQNTKAKIVVGGTVATVLVVLLIIAFG